MTIRIAMWSGPRNISTAMMRAFENRPDTAVVDEPFYAAYLDQTGLDHPMRDEVLISQPNDWREVVRQLDARRGPVVYEKQMAHHMLDGMGLDWIATRANAFLIRDPAEVLASYIQKRGEVTLADIGVVRQNEIFQREANRLGHAPPVVSGQEVLADPRGILTKLCEALGIGFDEAMLTWPPGPRDSDGVWAPAWYDSVERSTGFERPTRPAYPPLPDDLRRVADQARPLYEAMAAHRIA